MAHTERCPAGLGPSRPPTTIISGERSDAASEKRHDQMTRSAEPQIHPGALRGLPLRQQTLPALLERQATTFGEKPLLRVGDIERSFIDVRNAAARAAGTLMAAGIGPGDRVALMCENRIELLDLMLGCAWRGAVAVPLNTALRGAQLAHQVTNSGARGLAMDSGLIWTLGYVDRPPTLEFVWALDGPPPSTPPDYAIADPPDPASPVASASVGPGDTAAILYTSGTTGLSKGVCCPQAQFYWWGILVGEMLDISESDILYTCLPLFHTNALNAFVQALVAGATFHLGPRFSASRFWPRLTDSGATVTYLLGAMVNILLSRPPGNDDRKHIVRRALAPATPAPAFETFRSRFGIQLVEGYGSTETNCPIGVSWHRQRPGWMGQVRDGFEARVVNGDDEDVGDGESGELVLRHRPAFAFATGYFAMPEKTVEASRNLWFHTGDRVVRDADGWFRFTDRLTDSIRRRGENISSFEVEQVVLSHPDVDAVAVFPVASELGEDEVAAAVIVRNSASADHESIVRWCEPRLAYFAIPRFIRFVQELPLTASGKVRKSALREEGVTAETWDRETAGVVLTRGSPRPSRD
jgi:carnitine-CoA ligase